MEWDRGRKIGHGSSATVNLAVPKNNNEVQLPLMAVKSSQLINSAMLKNEKYVLDQLGNSCPQIIQCFGGDCTFEKGVDFYNILLEYANGGSLADYVKNRGNRVSETEVKSLTKSILQGLRFMHEKGFVHCDVKLQNILLCDGLVKIADFGLSKKTGEENRGVEFRGTPLYMSPESVSGGEYDFPVDIWALGCAVVEMVTGTPPWKIVAGGNMAALLMKIGAGDELPEIPCVLSDEGRDFLSRCFVKDPLKRWTAEMLLDHPFITSDQRPVLGELSPRDPFEFSEWNKFSVSGSGSVLNSLRMDFQDRPAVLRRLELVFSSEDPSWDMSSSWMPVR